MTTEFKTALRPYLFNGVYVTPSLLVNIQNWPQIPPGIDWHPEDEDEEEHLNLENFTFISYTDTSLKICSSRNGRLPYEIVITMIGNNIIVESCTESEFNGEGINHNEIEALFTGIRVRPPAERPVAPTPKWVIEMDLKRAIKREDYKEAVRLRDILLK